LVYLLSRTRDEKVAKLRAPDGGLDTVRPADEDPLIAEWGIQAKLYREHIKWAGCRESLDRAVNVWQARYVTFAFPRDLTVNQHKLFHKHLGSRHPSVRLDWWGATELTALLLENPAGRGIAKRFFHTEDPSEIAERAIRAGKPLSSAADLLDHESLTGSFLQSADPHVTWVETKRSRSQTPLPRTENALLRLEIADEEQEVVFDAVPRSLADAGRRPEPTVGFDDSPEGRRARELLRAVETQGGRAELGNVSFRIDHIPAPFDELFKEGAEGDLVVRSVRTAAPWAAALAVETDTGEGELELDLVAAEPEHEWDAKLVGERHGLRIEIRFVWSHTTGQGSLRLVWHFSRASGSNVQRTQVLAVVVALHGEGRFKIEDRDGQRPPLEERTAPHALPRELVLLHHAYRDLAYVEEFAGASFGPPPDQFTSEEAKQLAWLADALRNGGYDASLSSWKVACGAEGLAQLRSQGASDVATSETLCMQLFGSELRVAQRVIKLPPMTMRSAVRRRGSEALWDVEFVPLAGESQQVRNELRRLEDGGEQAAA
jgi:hypothetical protein